MSTVTLPLELVERLIKWRLCMSYNDSYFGEPEGELKRLTEEIERAAQPVAPTQSGEPVTWRDAIKSYPSPDMTLAPQPSQPVEAGEACAHDYVRSDRVCTECGEKSAVVLDEELIDRHWRMYKDGRMRSRGNHKEIFRQVLQSVGNLLSARAASQQATATRWYQAGLHAALNAVREEHLSDPTEEHGDLVYERAVTDCENSVNALIIEQAVQQSAATQQVQTVHSFAPFNRETQDQIAAVMLQHGTPDQRSRALVYAAAGINVAQPAQTERALTLPDRLEVPAVTFGLSRRYALGWNDCLDAIGAAQPAAGGDRG